MHSSHYSQFSHVFAYGFCLSVSHKRASECIFLFVCGARVCVFVRMWSMVALMLTHSVCELCIHCYVLSLLCAAHTHTQLEATSGRNISRVSWLYVLTVLPCV